MTDNNMLNTRKATPQDLPEIERLFKAAVAHMIENGIMQWDEVYPAKTDFVQDIERGEMYLCIFGEDIASVFVLNKQADALYQTGNWQIEGEEYLVVHRLCVHPAFQGRGTGSKTVAAFEETARTLGAKCIRLDAFSQNPAALHMYAKAGYSKTGEVIFRKGLFYLYEKEL